MKTDHEHSVERPKHTFLRRRAVWLAALVLLASIVTVGWSAVRNSGLHSGLTNQEVEQRVTRSLAGVTGAEDIQARMLEIGFESTYLYDKPRYDDPSDDWMWEVQADEWLVGGRLPDRQASFWITESAWVRVHLDSKGTLERVRSEKQLTGP